MVSRVEISVPIKSRETSTSSDDTEFTVPITYITTEDTSRLFIQDTHVTEIDSNIHDLNATSENAIPRQPLTMTQDFGSESNLPNTHPSSSNYTNKQHHKRMCSLSDGEESDKVRGQKPLHRPRSDEDIDSKGRPPRTTDVQLLPPHAFLFKKDGTPVMNAVGSNKTYFSTSASLLHAEGGDMGPPFDAWNNKCSKIPSAVDDTLDLTFTTVATAVSSPRVVTTIAETAVRGEDGSPLEEEQFVSPAEEMIHIRNRLRTFKENKNKLR